MHYASKLHDLCQAITKLTCLFKCTVYICAYQCISEYICANKTNLWAGSLCMSVMQIIVLHPYTNFEVCRPSRFEDKADYQSQC